MAMTEADYQAIHREKMITQDLANQVIEEKRKKSDARWGITKMLGIGKFDEHDAKELRQNMLSDDMKDGNGDFYKKQMAIEGGFLTRGIANMFSSSPMTKARQKLRDQRVKLQKETEKRTGKWSSKSPENSGQKALIFGVLSLVMPLFILPALWFAAKKAGRVMRARGGSGPDLGFPKDQANYRNAARKMDTPQRKGLAVDQTAANRAAKNPPIQGKVVSVTPPPSSSRSSSPPPPSSSRSSSMDSSRRRSSSRRRASDDMEIGRRSSSSRSRSPSRGRSASFSGRSFPPVSQLVTSTKEGAVVRPKNVGEKPNASARTARSDSSDRYRNSTSTRQSNYGDKRLGESKQNTKTSKARGFKSEANFTKGATSRRAGAADERQRSSAATSTTGNYKAGLDRVLDTQPGGKRRSLNDAIKRQRKPDTESVRPSRVAAADKAEKKDVPKGPGGPK